LVSKQYGIPSDIHCVPILVSPCIHYTLSPPLSFTHGQARGTLPYGPIRKVPRVIKGKDLKLKWGPQYFNVNILTPKEKISQVLFAHYVVLAPGGRSQKHGHMNEAMFYILDGKGHEIHDGVRYDWEAGDVVVVENSCVHQHFNDDPERPARAIIIKSKPLYLFMNMVMQEVVEEQPKEPVPGHENFEPSYFPK